MISPRYLTKSRFKLAVECPTKLFYSSKQSLYKNTKHEDSFLRMLADGGFQVGELAKVIYKDAHEISTKDPKEALEITKKLLAENENITLLEPAIEFENLLVRIDVLIKRNNTFELIEVKAKSYNSDNPEIEGKTVPIRKEMLPYIQDVAFQKYVLSKAYPNSTISTYLMLPDKAINSSIDSLNQMFKVEHSNHQTKVIVDKKIYSVIEEAKNLLAKVSVDKLVNIVLENEINAAGLSAVMPELARTLAKAYETDTKIAPKLTSTCSACEFKASPNDALKSGFHECLKEVTKWSDKDLYQLTVLDIWDFRRKTEFLGKGLYKPSELTQDDIKYKDDKEGLSRTQRQWLQCQGIPTEDDFGGFYVELH
jgi:hypothetical protein